MAEESEDRHVRPFAEWLVEQRKGALASEMADSLNKLVDAVNMHHKGGTLTLKISVKPAANSSGTVVVADDVTLKAPQGERDAVIYFVDSDSNLSRANPAQHVMELREVPTPETTAPKEANAQ